MKQPHVWVVERKDSRSFDWRPIHDQCGHSHIMQARREVQEWRDICEGGGEVQFRIAKYVRQP